MPKPIASSKVIVIACLLSFSAGCTIHSIHNETYVGSALSDRTGHSLRPPGAEGGTKLPPDVSPADGLSEDEAVAIALWNNAQFLADLAELGFSRADLIEAGLLRNPVLSLLFPLGPKQLEFTLSLPVELLWQRPNRIAEAKLNAEKIADNLVQHGLDLSRDVMAAHAELVWAQARAEIKSRETAYHKELARIASVRLDIGDISELEEAPVRKKAAEVRQAAFQAERDVALAEQKLKTLLGLVMDDTAIRPEPAPLPDASPPKANDLLAAGFAARPDLRAAEIAIEAAGRRVGWERSKILNITAMLDANGEGKQGFEMGPGFLAELPLLNHNNARIARAQAELEQAARQYMAVKHRITQEILDARARAIGAKNAVDLLRREALPAAVRETEKARAKYALGEISYSELAVSELRLLDSRLLEAEVEASLRKSNADLKHSLGFKSVDK